MSDLPYPFPAPYGREWPQKMGFIDNAGKVVIPQDFDFSHHSKFSSSGYAWVKQATRRFAIDVTGRMVFEMPSDMFSLWYVPPDDAGIFPVEHRLDHKSPWAYVQDGRDRVYRGRSKYYAMDLNGDIRFEGYITDALHGHYIFQDLPGLNAPKGIMNRNGDVVVPAVLNRISTSKSEPYLSVTRDGRFGVIDFQGNELLPINKPVKHWLDFSRVENGLVQYFDRFTQMCPSQTIAGEVVGQLPPNHGMHGLNCPTISDGLALLHWERHDGDAIYVDAYGRYMLGENGKPKIFAPDVRMDFFYEGLASIRQDDKTGFIDKTGEVVIPRAFYGASNFSGGIARATGSHDDHLNHRYCYINREGEIVAKNH